MSDPAIETEQLEAKKLAGPSSSRCVDSSITASRPDSPIISPLPPTLVPSPATTPSPPAIEPGSPLAILLQKIGNASTSGIRWLVNFHALRSFVEQHGHTAVQHPNSSVPSLVFSPFLILSLPHHPTVRPGRQTTALSFCIDPHMETLKCRIFIPLTLHLDIG
mmetsp:Transcript_26197/g.60235  ORF Transcript_26197/g.60235 Transcript_26197/m.60235 type:complete len:163 (+) Transcript_26197:44-532(+)